MLRTCGFEGLGISAHGCATAPAGSIRKAAAGRHMYHTTTTLRFVYLSDRDYKESSTASSHTDGTAQQHMSPPPAIPRTKHDLYMIQFTLHTTCPLPFACRNAKSMDCVSCLHVAASYCKVHRLQQTSNKRVDNQSSSYESLMHVLLVLCFFMAVLCLHSGCMLARTGMMYIEPLPDAEPVWRIVQNLS